MKSSNKIMIITTVLCLLPILLSIALYNRLPSQMPIHFNATGEIDGYAPKYVLAFIFPLAMAAFNLFLHFVARSYPKKDNVSSVLVYIAWLIIPAITLIFVPVLLFISLGVSIPIYRVIPIFLGLMFILVGNYLPKCKQNYAMGIKLPWTLNNEENWNKTHRLGGFIWAIGGFVIITLSLLSIHVMYLMFIVIIVMMLIPLVYSYCLHKKGL